MNLWVRWCFVYDDRTYKVGVWNYDGPNMAEKWQFQRLHQMITAQLQVKDLSTGQTSVLHECTRDQFLHFAWIGKIAINPGVIPKSGVTQRAQEIGLQLHQRNGWKVTAFNDGRIVRKQKEY